MAPKPNGTEVYALALRASRNVKRAAIVLSVVNLPCAVYFRRYRVNLIQVISSWASFHDTSVSTPGALKHSHCHREVRSHRFEQLKAREALSMFITKN